MANNDKTFLDQLTLLRAGDFGGGYAQYGQAIQKKQENETLVELYNKFKVNRDELMTTDEQVNEFSKDVKSAGGLDKDGLPADVTAGLDMLGNLSRQKSWSTLYQPFITTFSQLGDDGINVAKTLTNDLSTKISQLKDEMEIPFKQMEHAKLKFDLKFDEIKLRKTTIIGRQIMLYFVDFWRRKSEDVVETIIGLLCWVFSGLLYDASSFIN